MTELDDLSKKIAAAKKKREASPENLKASASEEDSNQDMSFGMRIGVELFAGILVGAVLGCAIDYFAHTLPLFLVIFTIIGACAGFWSIYKSFFADDAKK